MANILVESKCKKCDKIFMTRRDKIAKGFGQFCSRSCANSYYKRVSLIEIPCKLCGRIFYKYMSQFKFDNVSFCSAKCLRDYQRKENNPNWKGGITNENIIVRMSLIYDNWRKSVFTRDNYTCRKCGDNTGGNLNAHHIIPFSIDKSLRFEISNGITLCKKCHRKLHASQKKSKQMDIFYLQCKKGEDK